jgi:aminoglycoside phosphotransferase (APT) family kinase protein
MPIPQQRDPELTRKQLGEWLAAKLPDATGLSISELSGPAATGFSNDTLLFDATWTEAGATRVEGLVARIKPSGYQIFPEIDVALQHRVMKILGEHTDVPVPRMWWLEEDERVLGAPFFLMSRVDGDIPADNPPYTMGGWVFDARPDQRERLWWTGLDAMARVHRLDWRALGFEFLDHPELGATGLDQQLTYYERYLEWAARGKPQPIAEAALDWVKVNRPRDEEPLALCWGDSRISNQIFRDFECVSVLDWEMVTLGNPEQDLGWWIFLDRHFTEGLGLDRPAGFPSYDDTVARYEELTGHTVRHLDYYQLFAGLRFAVIMMRVAQMTIEYELMPADSDLETNNIVTQLLAKMLGLPPPGPAIAP